jgi:hypothetical protein
MISRTVLHRGVVEKGRGIPSHRSSNDVSPVHLFPNHGLSDYANPSPRAARRASHGGGGREIKNKASVLGLAVISFQVSKNGG